MGGGRATSSSSKGGKNLPYQQIAVGQSVVPRKEAVDEPGAVDGDLAAGR